MKMKNKMGIVSLLLLLLTACNESYLNVIPDNVATIENAFNMRTNGEKYLFTCYSWMPRHGNIETDPAMLAGDELWTWENSIPGSTVVSFNHAMFRIAEGLQNKIDPYGNFYWDNLYRGIRDCNIFLENVDKIPDMSTMEKKQWIAEVKFLKAYYHFYLVKIYGPIPVVRENLPIDASVEEVRVSREPVEDCFNYIVQLLDEAKDDLPLTVNDPTSDLGRITKPIAMAVKAKVLVFRASPLFNGNSQLSALKNNDGTQLFDSEFKIEKWNEAAVACQEAIDVCHSAGNVLYTEQGYSAANLSDTTRMKLTIRNAICQKWNNEIIWGDADSYVEDLQMMATARVDETNTENYRIRQEIAVPLRIADQYYTDNGVPIDEDKTWDYNGRYGVRAAGESEALLIENGYTTTKYNFNREMRYYGSVGFDGAIIYGHGKYNEDDLYSIHTKFSQVNNNNQTGIYVKKMIHYENVSSGNNIYSRTTYPMPVIRLADLYLLYAEALNEFQGPSDEALEYVNRVRERVGLKTVQESWTIFSTNPSKYTSKEGFRDILHQERLIELSFEGKRYWDIRRWKTAPQIVNGDIRGWSMDEKESVAYSKPRVIASQTFGIKDYFFPIKDAYILQNRNLVQNLGW